MAIVDVTKESFEENIKEGLKLVDLWAPWCGSCKMIMPSVDAIGEENKDNLDVLKVNIDEEEDIANELEVMSIPTLILYKDGEQVASLNGFVPKESIEQMIEENR